MKGTPGHIPTLRKSPIEPKSYRSFDCSCGWQCAWGPLETVRDECAEHIRLVEEARAS